MITEVQIRVDLKVFPEGHFNGTEMNTNLIGLSGFPLSQPYNSAPWNYNGTEATTSISANKVDNSDKNEAWETQIGATGYYPGDFNMDGIVNDLDKVELWDQNAGKASPVVE